MRAKRACSGLMLTDVMVAISLGLLLLSILFELYLAAHKSLKQQHDLLDLQNNAAVVIDALSNEIHEAGYIGCPCLDESFHVISHLPWMINQSNRLVGTEAGELMMRHASQPASLISLSQDHFIVTADNSKHFSGGDILLISDCKHAELVIAEKVNTDRKTQRIKLSQAVQYNYEQTAEVSKLTQNTFYLTRKNENTFSFMLRDIDGITHELATGITSLKFLYTVKNAGVWKDIPARNVINWSEVAAVAIELQMHDKTWRAYVRLGSI